MAGLGSIDFGGLGGAVSSVFGGIGTLQSAKGFKTAGNYARLAATYAGQNATIAEASGRVQLLQQQRKAAQVIGGQQADVAGAGFTSSGSALDLLRQSTENAALDRALVGEQSQINVSGYKEEQAGKLGEAAQYDAQAAAAKTSGIGGIVGGIMKGATALAMFSDERLKCEIKLHGFRPDGIGIYSFRYLGGDTHYLGCIAQQVQQIKPEAVVKDERTGYFKVRYDMLGFMVAPLGTC